MIKYEHPDFKFETCGWCDKNATPRVKDVNGQLRFYYKKYICNDKTCEENRKKVNPRSYESARKTYKLSEEKAKLKVQQASPFHREFFKTDEQYTKFQAQCSLRSFVERFGHDEGHKKFDEYRELRSYLASEQHFIDELGEEEGKIKYANILSKKAITRENLQQKYGIEEGDRRYERFLDKTLHNFVSAASVEFLDEISRLFSINIKHGKNSPNEKKIVCANTMHPVDGYCEEYNIVFEYFGDKWHVNPKLFTKDDVNAKRKPAEKIWREDKERLNNIIQVVNAVFVIWGHDWKYSKQRIIDHFSKLLNQLKQKTLEKKVYYLGETDV